jgi:protein arginine N-methyltransferase 5
MATVPETDEMVHSFCIGQHESNRLTPITPHVVRSAHAGNVSIDRDTLAYSHY